MESQNEKRSIYNVKDLFDFLQNYIDNPCMESTEGIVSIIHRCLKENATSKQISDINNHLLNLITQYLNNEEKLLLLTQVIYQIGHTMLQLEHNPYKIDSEVCLHLYSELHKYDNKMLRARIIACLEVYLKVQDDFRVFVIQIWKDIKTRAQQTSNILNQTDLQLLMTLFDQFVTASISNMCNERIIISTLKNLLNSDIMERKIAYCLLKKVIKLMFNESNWMWKDLKIYWNVYVNTLESLEEEQTHLILPNLMNVQKFREFRTLIPHDYIMILNKRLLQHKNVLVIRWTIEYILSVYTCDDLNKEILHLFLEATNNNNLFNYEGYYLPLDKFKSFLTNNLTVFYKVFGNINWKSIPMYIWLEQLLNKDNREPIPYDCLLRIASRARALTNYRIRQKVLELMNKNFCNVIKEMTLKEYVLYVETLYNITDIFKDGEILFQKNFSCLENNVKTLFSQRFYEILKNNVMLNISDFINFIKKIPSRNHEWLRFAAVYFLSKIKEHWTVLKELYNLDLINLNSDSILNTFVKLLVWDVNDKNQSLHANLLAFHIIIQHFSKDKYTMNADQISLIQYMAPYDLHVVIGKANLDNYTVVQEILQKLHNMKNQYHYEDLVRALHENLRDNYINIYRMCRKQLYVIYPSEFFQPDINILEDNDTKVLFNGEFLTGDTRIEEIFNVMHFYYKPNKIILTSMWLHDLHTNGNGKYLAFLLNCHRQLTEKKSRYFKNSTEHRAKFKIVCGIYVMIKNIKENVNQFLDEIWEILLNETNQPNITIIYEYILGKHETRWDVVSTYIKQISNFTPHQQISVITVAGYMWKHRTDMYELNTILNFWLPLTMGSNYQTRLYSQLFLYIIVENWNDFKENTLLQTLAYIIKTALNDKMYELLENIRFKLVNLFNENEFSIIQHVVNATDTPYDEYVIPPDYKINNEISIHKIMFNEKRNTRSIETKENLKTDFLKENTDTPFLIQRKVVPSNNINLEANLITHYNDSDLKSKPEIYVVASLVDKLPNLGGIARTCEVFGIKYLVLDSKMHITKADFKNLSMTAEQSLNIIEVKSKDLLQFLMEKQIEGFALIGAEQTTDSHNFYGFKFPKRCILLLGHEKNGIPPPLLSILDSAVEIPQLGKVRSLNVHVSAALFMWEYVKQHRMVQP